VTSAPVQMVSSFRGLNELVQTRRGSGVISDWKQNGGFLMVGGDSRVIRVWDAHTESLLMDLETKSDSPVTSIASDPTSSPTFLAGFADGTVNLFDRRLPEEDAIVRSYCEHLSWIENARWHPTLSGKFLSASLDGEVRIWDLRADAAVNSWEVYPQGISAFDVHCQAGVFAALSAVTSTSYRYQRATVQSLNPPAILSHIDFNTGLTGPSAKTLPSPFIPRPGSLTFHPLEMLYSVGTPDGTLRILGCKTA